MVSFIVIRKSFEVRENNESLDTIFKGHVLQLRVTKNFRVKKIAYFFTRDLFSFTFLQETLKSFLAL